MEAPERDFVVIDGKSIRITKLPPAPIDPDMQFDRWQHDDVGHSPDISRSDAQAYKNWDVDLRLYGKPVIGTNGRVRPKKQV